VPVNAVTPALFVIGPALVYYRAVGVNTPWTSVGATLDDAVMRLPTSWAGTQEQLSGVMGPVMGLDVLTRVGCEIEFTLPEMAGEKLGLAIPGAVYTAPVSADAGGSPLNTTLAAAAAAGATTISVASATNAAVGDYVHIAGAAGVEYRQITAISGTDLSFRDPLLFAHASGQVVKEATGDNRSVVTMPTVRRQPDSAYREWALVSESGKSGVTELRIPRAISQTTGAEVTIGDDAIAGLRVTIAGRLDPTNLQASIFQLFAPNPA
jgi:hypothetical protein